MSTATRRSTGRGDGEKSVRIHTFTRRSNATKGPAGPFVRFDRCDRQSAGLHLDLDLDTSRQVDALKAVDGLLLGIDDVDETLVNAHLEVLT